MAYSPNTIITDPTSGLQANVVGSDAVNAVSVMIAAPSKSTFMVGSGSFSPPATPTDLWTIIGSSTKTVKILKIFLMATQTTAAADIFFLKRYSSANTGGTATTVTPIALDTNDGSATAVVKFYTANPTLGTLVGSLDEAYMNVGAPGSLDQTFEWDFTNNLCEPLTLRGAAQQISVNFNGVALPAGLKVAVTVLFTEE